MPQTIFFRIGTGDKISLSAFIDALSKFLGILRDLDSALSHDRRGSVDWEVAVLQKNSPPLVGVTPLIRRLSVPDMSDAIESQFIENTMSLTLRGERNKFMPDSALLKLKGIAKRTKRTGPMSVYVNGDGRAKRETVINPVTLKNVRELTDPKFSAYGSIVGDLDSISVHRGDEFRVWDKVSGKAVRCFFERTQEDVVKNSLRKTVTVAGLIQSNSAGLPISVDVEELEPAQDAASPTLEQISGLVDDFTEGKSMKEFMDDISNE